MADDIRIEITGDSKDIKKVIKTANKLLTRFEKTAKKSTERRVKNEQQSAQKQTAIEERKNNRMAAMDKRLSRKRARNRLRGMKERIRIAKREAAAEERIKKRSSARLGKLGKFGGAIAGLGGAIGLVAAVKEIAKFDLALTRMAGTQDLTAKKVMEVRDAIMASSVATGVGRDKILETVTAIVDKSGDVDLATNNMLMLGKAIAVVGEDSAGSIGDLLAALSVAGKGGTLSPTAMFESIIALGDKANITLEDTARGAKKLVGGFATTGGTTQQDFAEYLALYQSIGSMKNPEEANTAVNKFYTDIQKNSKGLRAKGIEIYSDKARTKLKSTKDILKMMMDKSGGSLEKLQEMLPVTEAIQVVFEALKKDMMDNNGEMRRFNTYTRQAGEGSGNIQKKFDRISKTSASAFNKIETLTTSLLDKALAPAVDDLAESLSKMLGDPEAIKNMTSLFEALGIVIKGAGKGIELFTKIGIGLGYGLAQLHPDVAAGRRAKEQMRIRAIPENLRTENQKMELLLDQKNFIHIDKEGNIISEEAYLNSPDTGNKRVTRFTLSQQKNKVEEPFSGSKTYRRVF